MAKCIIPHLVGEAAGDEGAEEDGDDLAWVRVASNVERQATPISKRKSNSEARASEQAQEQQRSKFQYLLFLNTEGSKRPGT